MKQIKPIHPFGPPVGKWKSGVDVAATFKRVKREIAKQQDQGISENHQYQESLMDGRQQDEEEEYLEWWQSLRSNQHEALGRDQGTGSGACEGSGGHEKPSTGQHESPL